MPEPQIYILVALLMNALLAGVIFARDPTSSENRWYALMCLALVYWGLVQYLHFTLATTPEQAFRFFAISTPGWALLVPIFLMFVRAHVGNRGWLKTPLFPFIFLCSGIFLSIIAWKKGWLVDEMVRAEHGGFVHEPGFLYTTLGLGHLSLGLLVALIHLFMQLRRNQGGDSRRRTSMVFVGMLVPLLGGVVVPIIHPSIGISQGPHLLISLTAINTVVVGLGMLRYQLFSITLERTAQTIVEAVTEGIVLCDLEGTIEFTNPSAWNLLDREPGQLQGTNLRTLMEPAHEVNRALTMAARGRPVNGEGVVVSRTGEPTPIEYTFSTIRDPGSGRIAGLACVLRDVGALKSLIKQLEEASSRLQEQVVTDPLTGVFNRRYLEARLEDEFHACQRYARMFSMVMLDLDHFKDVNDTMGHDAGDQLLVSVAEILSACVRASDVVTRFGGDEFVILMPETPNERALQVTRRLQVSIRSALGKGDIPVTATFGIVTFSGNEPVESAADLMRRADEALLTAKQLGRDCIRVAKLPDPLPVKRTESSSA